MQLINCCSPRRCSMEVPDFLKWTTKQEWHCLTQHYFVDVHPSVRPHSLYFQSRSASVTQDHGRSKATPNWDFFSLKRNRKRTKLRQDSIRPVRKASERELEVCLCSLGFDGSEHLMTIKVFLDFFFQNSLLEFVITFLDSNLNFEKNR